MSKSIVFKQLADAMIAICGAGRVLVTGESAQELCSVLCLRDIRTELFSSLPEALQSSPLDVDTVFCLDFFNKVPEGEKTAKILNKLYQSSSRYVCVYINGEVNSGATPTQIFEDWERVFFEAGFRRHPRLFHELDYQGREYPPSQRVLFFERIPDTALELFSLQRLHESRLLHMDMLRDSGRRSDAHTIRYFMASAYIRPGDTVLDCACGLGYGSHILYNNSRAKRIVGLDYDKYAIEYAKNNYARSGVIDFESADAQNLSAFADNSFDFIASFETIEHLSEPEKYLRELFRVLRPSGRIMISAPDRWVDETGKDPNPHHFHVYDWEKLYAEFSGHFLPEKGFIQVAGGALKCPNGSRIWEEVPCQPTLDKNKESEWVLLLGMKDPLLGRNVPYIETTFPDSNSPEWHVGAFGKDYLNPWLLKGMISIGFRLENPAMLENIRRQVIETYPEDSVDYGAALCGSVYQLLSNSTASEEFEDLMKLVEKYVELKHNNPHVMRWQVSLLFAMALFHRKNGEMEEAESLFERCAMADVQPYSPLLGNRTVDALYSAAILALGRKDTELARKRLALALEEVIRLAQGSWLNIVLDPKTPFEPGFPEMAQLMDKAARCCYMLGELDSVNSRSGLAHSRGQGWYEAMLGSYAHQLAAFRQQIANQQEQIANQQEQIANLQQQIEVYKQRYSPKFGQVCKLHQNEGEYA